MSVTMAAQTHLVLKEEDVVKLACEFMENREMTISQVSLERESGVINGDLSDDILFLRQLIIDGQVVVTPQSVAVRPSDTSHDKRFPLFPWPVVSGARACSGPVARLIGGTWRVKRHLFMAFCNRTVCLRTSAPLLVIIGGNLFKRQKNLNYI